MQKRHSPVRDQPDQDLAQFPQIRLFPLLQLQTMPQDLCGELVESSRVDWNGSLQIANRNFRNCHSERSEESLKVAGQTKSISEMFRFAQHDIVLHTGGRCSD